MTYVVPGPCDEVAGGDLRILAPVHQRDEFPAVLRDSRPTRWLFYWRNNDDARLPWSPPYLIPGTSGRGGYRSVSLIQNSYDGRLELLAERRLNHIIDHYTRDRALTWRGPYPTL